MFSSHLKFLQQTTISLLIVLMMVTFLSFQRVKPQRVWPLTITVMTPLAPMIQITALAMVTQIPLATQAILAP